MAFDDGRLRVRHLPVAPDADPPGRTTVAVTSRDQS